MPIRSRLQVATSLQALTELLDWFETFKNNPLPEPVWIQCQLAVVEGFTNAVRHAHRSLTPETPIELELTILPTEVQICIWDYGPFFDLEAFLAQRPLEVDHDAEGGRGLLLMQQLSDTLSYTRTSDSRNCLCIKKQLLPLIVD